MNFAIFICFEKNQPNQNYVFDDINEKVFKRFNLLIDIFEHRFHSFSSAIGRVFSGDIAFESRI